MSLFTLFVQWMESVVFHAHLSPALSSVISPLLRAGDDAAEVKWMRCGGSAADEEDLNRLYASHKAIVQLAVQQWKETRRKEKQEADCK